MNQDRKAESRRLADQGLTEREIAERLGVSQPTVHRDLAGHEKPSLPQPDPALADTDDRRKAAEMKAEADRLTELQREHRGWVPGPVIEGKPSLVLGPYVPTSESEARAAEIGHLRKTAARLLYPTPKGTYAHR